MSRDPHHWRGAMRWGRGARWLPTPREGVVIVAVAVLLVLGVVGMEVLPR